MCGYTAVVQVVSAIKMYTVTYCNMISCPKTGFNTGKDMRLMLFCSRHCEMTEFVEKTE